MTKKEMSKKFRRKKCPYIHFFRRNFFDMSFLVMFFLHSSEMHFDIVTIKIRANILFCSKKNYVREVPPPKLPVREGFNPSHRPQTPDTFGLNPPSQLAIGYHWLAFLNLVQNLKFCWTKKIKKNRNLFCIRFRSLCIFWDKINDQFWSGMERGSACRSLGQGQQ